MARRLSNPGTPQKSKLYRQIRNFYRDLSRLKHWAKAQKGT